jgi:tetratricopeptide (TPR) repeat protein
MVMILVGIAGFVIVVAALFVAREFVAGIAGELGKRSVDAASNRRVKSRRRRSARVAAKGGGTCSAVLCAFAGDAAENAHAVLRGRFDPSASITALLDTLDELQSPFHSRPAVMLAIGSGAENEKQMALGKTGRRVIYDAVAVDISGKDEQGDSIPEILKQRIDELGPEVYRQATKIGGFVAVTLLPPLTGTWETELELNIEGLLSGILTHSTCDTWLTVLEPPHAGSWPSTVSIDCPLPRKVFKRALENERFSLAPLATWANQKLVLPGGDASHLVAELAGIRAFSVRGVDVMPRYSPAMTLALKLPGDDARGSVEVYTNECDVIRDYLRATGIQIFAHPDDDVEVRLPQSAFPIRTIAWTVSRTKAEGMAPQLDVDAEASESVRWLAEAIEAKDQNVAAAVLAVHGRAWLELDHSRHALETIGRAREVFDVSSEAHLWSHYLLGLDSALHREDPSEEWFALPICTIANNTELGLLFQAEHMEFRRLRGDLPGAVDEANQLIGRIQNQTLVPASRGYAEGTARYVLANVLRAGGRYDIARRYIQDAKDYLDPSLPSHRIELTHANYGEGVCDSMFGIASIHGGDGWSPSEAVFARSLVTLANCHASWFVDDYVRAVEFATIAERGFETIGYDRYARRAQTLRTLILDWADRAGSPVRPFAVRDRDRRVTALLDAPIGASVSLLAAERPSRCLSLLQFADAFGSARDSREVEMPELIVADQEGRLSLRKLAAASSYAEAEVLLRDAMGIGQDGRVPLAAD